MTLPNEITLVIPVFNNEGDLPETLREIDTALLNPASRVDAVFVDDGSDDGSFQILREYCGSRNNARVVRLSGNHGLNTALQAGFDNASAPVVVTMEAHVQHDVAEVFRLAGLLRDGADVVCARRVNRRDPPLRLAGSRVANGFIRAVCAFPAHDAACLLKAWRREAGAGVFSDPSYEHFIAAMKSLRVVETPVDFSRPRAGRSSFTLIGLIRVGAGLAKGALRLRFGGRKKPPSVGKPNYKILQVIGGKPHAGKD